MVGDLGAGGEVGEGQEGVNEMSPREMREERERERRCQGASSGRSGAPRASSPRARCNTRQLTASAASPVRPRVASARACVASAVKRSVARQGEASSTSMPTSATTAAPTVPSWRRGMVHDGGLAAGDCKGPRGVQKILDRRGEHLGRSRE